MPVTISGDGSVTGLTDWEATSVTHPDSVDTNITLADDGSVVFDSVPAAIQSAIDAVPVLAGIGSNVVQVVKTDTFSTTSATLVDVPDLSATITPTSTDSRVLVICQFSMAAGADPSQGVFVLSGGNSSAYVGDVAGSRAQGAVSVRVSGVDNANAYWSQVPASIVFLDAPNTTSAVTYKLQARRLAAGTVFLGRSGEDSNATLWGRTAGSLTAIEVAV